MSKFDSSSVVIPSSLLDRFLRYVKIDTGSDPDSSSFPSTQKQKDLSKLLVEELKSLGVSNAYMDDYGYVYASIEPSTTKSVPPIGFIAHVDTSPDMNGTGVNPQVHKNYDGSDIKLSDDYTLTVKSCPELKTAIGQTVITSDGSTLLGADDKSGVAEIMTLVEILQSNPQIEHGPIKIAFTVDEEVGNGVKYFDIEKFGAKFAYTVDGGGKIGSIEDETFSADSMHIVFNGKNVHPGYSKGTMINSMQVASTFISSLPKRLSPEHTEKKQGFIHPINMKSGVDSTEIDLILRSFKDQDLGKYASLVKRLAQRACSKFPGSSYTATVSTSYRNMKQILDKYPKVINYALDAVKMSGYTSCLESIRGGTDGCQLSYRGLPTANMFAGSNLFHSRFEWATLEVMEAACKVLLNLAIRWTQD